MNVIKLFQLVVGETLEKAMPTIHVMYLCTILTALGDQVVKIMNSIYNIL